MPAKKRITRRTIVGMKITAAEWETILDNVMSLDDNYAQIISDTPVEQPVQFTLDEWDDFGGYIAAEANHTEDKKLAKKLDAIFNKVQRLLHTHKEEEPSMSLKVHRPDEDAPPEKPEAPTFPLNLSHSERKVAKREERHEDRKASDSRQRGRERKARPVRD